MDFQPNIEMSPRPPAGVENGYFGYLTAEADPNAPNRVGIKGALYAYGPKHPYSRPFWAKIRVTYEK
jgi:hypothetical protein